jgi:CheY-like chemotaxis protein
MPETKSKLLIVDDEPSIRSSMSHVLAEIGYGVRCAEDGFSALGELRKEIPDILLSDLHMPGMTGFELLSVVRRRFPAIWTVAMSGMFSGDEVPSGVAADAFYQKGSSLGSLLKILEALPRPERKQLNHPKVSDTIRVHPRGQDPAGVVHVTIECPECLRTFPHPLDSFDALTHETECNFCRGSIHYAIVEPAALADGQAFQWGHGNRADGKQQPGSGAQVNY